jgi:hypothetical protein
VTPKGNGSAICRSGQARRPQARRQPAGRHCRRCGIYTEHIKPSHIIRKVILRQIAIVNYVNPL